MGRRFTMLIELPCLSDQSASELLDLLEQLVTGFDSHYYAQISRYRQRQREEEEQLQRELFEQSVADARLPRVATREI